MLSGDSAMREDILFIHLDQIIRQAANIKQGPFGHSVSELHGHVGLAASEAGKVDAQYSRPFNTRRTFVYFFI